MNFEGKFQFSGRGGNNTSTRLERNRSNTGNNNRRSGNNNNRGTSMRGLRLDRYASLLSRGPFGTPGNKTNSKSSTRVEKVKNQKNNKQNVTDEAVILAQATLDDFVEKYAENKSDSTYIQTLLGDDFGAVAEVMRHYYDTAYNNTIESMNNVIKLMTAKTFALNLLSAVKKKDEVFNDWDTIKMPIAALISLALDTHHTKMISDTKMFYVEIISEHIYNFEIKEIMTKFKLSEDAATDLIIGAPSFGQDMTDVDIKHYYGTILNMLINHGKSAMDYMNAENQRNLFYHIFKDDNRVAIKAVAHCFGDEMIVFEEEADEALYTEYVKMLYDVLNEHDLDDIRFVLRYIVKVRAGIQKEGKDTITVFDVKKAVEYENIKTALLDYIESSDSAKTFLAD